MVSLFFASIMVEATSQHRSLINLSHKKFFFSKGLSNKISIRKITYWFMNSSYVIAKFFHINFCSAIIEPIFFFLRGCINESCNMIGS